MPFTTVINSISNNLVFVTVSHTHSILVFAGKARACKGAPLEPSLSGLRVKFYTTALELKATLSA